MYFLILCMILAFSAEVSCQTADACDLRRYILNSPLRENVNFWICMIYHGTNFTYATVKFFDVGPRFGLFQVQSPTWCAAEGQNDKGKNYCNIDCNKFLDSDPRDDMACVSKIYELYGLNYWKSWTSQCGKATNELTKNC